MISFTNKTRWLLAAAATCGIGFVIMMEFTDWHRLEAVTLDGEEIKDPQRALGLNPRSSVLEQPLQEVAARLLANDQTVKVDFNYSLPGSLRIETNRFTPICHVLDKSSGRLFGLNHQGRVVPLREDYCDWEHPVITGVSAGRIFDLCDDPRVALLAPQLVQLADDNVELFRLIDEIDMSSRTFITLTMSGLPFTLKADAAAFLDQTLEFVRFLERYDSEVATAKVIDLRFANMIVQESRRN